LAAVPRAAVGTTSSLWHMLPSVGTPTPP
jgi:hypothetical protein